MENFIGLMVDYIKVIGKMVNNMGKDNIKEQIKFSKKVNGLMEN